MEEIITVNGKQFKLTTDNPLTMEQKAQTIAEIRKQTGCGTCGPKITHMGNDGQYEEVKALAATCNVSSRNTGQSVNLTFTAHGTGPLTYRYWRQQGSNPRIQFGVDHTNISSDTPVTDSYIVQSGDGGTWNFYAEATDFCGTICGTSFICPVDLNPAPTVCTSVSDVTSSNDIINVNMPVTLSALINPLTIASAIQFKDQNGNVLASCNTTGMGTNSCSISWTPTVVGTYNIKAYSTPGNCISINAKTVTVNPTVVTICTWITSKGGMSGITVPNIFTLIDAYLTIVNIGFTPTVTQIFACIDYYLGLITVAQFDTRTGCTF